LETESDTETIFVNVVLNRSEDENTQGNEENNDEQVNAQHHRPDNWVILIDH